MQIAWLPPRGAVDEEPAAPRAPGLGGERLRLLERVSASGPMSTPSMPDGMSMRSAASPTASRNPGSAPAPPLWPGTWKRPGSVSARRTSASRYGVRR